MADTYSVAEKICLSYYQRQNVGQWL